MPLGMADVARFVVKTSKHNPKNPSWVNRDRFVLSAGHGSMLYYGLLHLSGYEQMTLTNYRNLDNGVLKHPVIQNMNTPKV